MRLGSLKTGCVIAVIAAAMLWSAATGLAQSPKESTSLKFAPARAVFYSTSLRHKEMLERITASKAFKRMVEHKVLSTVIAQGTMQYESGLEGFKQSNPEAWAAVRGFYEQGLTLLGDMFSHECFMYGGQGWVDAAPRMQAVSNKVNALVSQFARLSDEEKNAKLMEILDDSDVQRMLAELRTPETVMGFKISNKQLADDQLTVIAFGIKQGLASSPDTAPLQKMYKKETLAGGAFHVFTLDMTLITPEMLEKIKSAADGGEQAVTVINKLKTTMKNFKVVISLGRIDDYMIVSIANDNQHLANWGKEKLLIDSPEFAALKKAGSKKFTDINYASKEMAAAAGSPAAIEGQMAQIRQLRDQLSNAGISGEIPITEESIKKITDMYLEDMEKLQKFAQEQMNPRASLSFTYDVESGFESMSYSFGKETSLDGGKPLSILEHVGASPILFVAGRAVKSDDATSAISHVAKRALEFVDAIEFGDDEQGKEMQEIFDKVAEKGKPIVEKFVKITTEQVLPAMDDGQTALVLDASIKTDRLGATLPPSEDGVFLPEFAIVMGVTDAAKLREGLKAYLAVGRDLISAIREVSPEAIPEGVTLPDPEVTKEEGGELATYAIPAPDEVVGKFVMPTLGLGEDVAVLALHRDTAKRLLAKSELEDAAEELSEALEKPLAGASQFDFGRLMDVAESYLSYAVELGAFDGISAQAPFSAEELQEQTALVLDFLRCYERTTSVTYVEDGATVTRSISVYSDYEEEDEKK
jgi:hypothetical protein